MSWLMFKMKKKVTNRKWRWQRESQLSSKLATTQSPWLPWQQWTQYSAKETSAWKCQLPEFQLELQLRNTKECETSAAHFCQSIRCLVFVQSHPYFIYIVIFILLIRNDRKIKQKMNERHTLASNIVDQNLCIVEITVGITTSKRKKYKKKLNNK